MEDMKHLELGRDDSMLVITSAGDNVLHYAINAKPKRVSRIKTPCNLILTDLRRSTA
jgi:betaine lipid synthase